MNFKAMTIVSCSLAVALTACMPADRHAAAVRNNDNDRISVGKVQREIRVGMTTSDVVAVLGSPNIVTTDDKRQEQWVYDKISTETVHSSSSGGVGALILGGGTSPALAGGGGFGFGGSSGAAATNQRTLTIIVKFDGESKVRDFAYHNSSF